MESVNYEYFDSENDYSKNPNATKQILCNETCLCLYCYYYFINAGINVTSSAGISANPNAL